MKWWKIGIGIVGVAGMIWVFRMIMTPAPGTRMEDQGREHVAIAQSEAFAYNSNPPTSGPHNENWVRAGIYDTPQHDALLIHSLEHGYVIISYNCTVHFNAFFGIPKAFAHESESTGSSEVIPEATGSAVTDSNECKELVKNLEELANKKKLWKLIVVPRPQLDTTIALTAWAYIDKFDPLRQPADGGFDAKRIEAFIDYHRDQGPEKTME